jgi:hypothetical protein
MMPGLQAVALDRTLAVTVPYEQLWATVDVCRPLRIMSPAARLGRTIMMVRKLPVDGLHPKSRWAGLCCSLACKLLS